MSYHQMIVVLGWAMLALSVLVVVGLFVEGRARAYPRPLRIGHAILAAGIFLSGLGSVLRAREAGDPPALAIPGQLLIAVGVAIQVWVVMRSDRRPPS
ncbi:MAG TPA: hypothetical protein VNA89_00255 [Gemmatimonadaceae bacterium]|nr:hypothetical protein [Gemmatimonadaceae bacterium]